MADPGLVTEWLLAEYDATDPYDPSELDTACDNEDDVQIHGQRMLTFKSVMETGEPMRVTRTDYYDYGRWWL